MVVSIPYNYLDEKSANAYYLYAYLQLLSRYGALDEVVFPVDVLSYYTGMSSADVKNALQELDMFERKGKYVVAKKFQYNMEGRFINMLDREVTDLAPKLFQTMAAIISYSDFNTEYKGTKNFFTAASYDKLSEALCISQQTLATRLHSLEDCGMLYIVHGHMNVASHYCRPEYKELLNSYITNVKHVSSYVENNPKAKSLGHKYANIVAGKIYPEEEMNEIKQYVFEFNKRQIDLSKKIDGYSPKLKDTEVFDT